MGNQDIELQVDPSADGDKGVAQQEDKPPAPPKRDFQEEKEAPQPDKRQKLGSFPRPEVIYKPESTKTFMTCLKNLFILFNLIIWIFGAVLTGVGTWIKLDRDFWDIQTGLDMKQFTTAGYVLIAVGVFIMLVGFLGCYGAFSETIWMLIVYSVIVILIILLEIAVAAIVWTASNNKEMKENIKGKARKALQEVSESENQRYFLDLIQSKLKCCGIDGPDEYEEYGGVPRSCTNPETSYPYEHGCLDAAVKYFKNKASVLGGVAIAVFILQMAAIIIAVTLLVGLKQAAANSIF